MSSASARTLRRDFAETLIRSLTRLLQRLRPAQASAIAQHRIRRIEELMQSRSYMEFLSDVIREAKDAGLEEEAGDLEQSCFGAAFTTSSELLGEHGIALKRFVKATRGKLPPSTKAKLNACLVETGLAWPGWRRFLTYFGWRLRFLMIF